MKRARLLKINETLIFLFHIKDLNFTANVLYTVI